MASHVEIFILICLVLIFLQFKSPLFGLFQFILGYRLYRFDSTANQITKSTICPSLLMGQNEFEKVDAIIALFYYLCKTQFINIKYLFSCLLTRVFKITYFHLEKTCAFLRFKPGTLATIVLHSTDVTCIS